MLGENRNWRWLRSGRERVLFLGGIKWAEPDRENRGPDHHHSEDTKDKKEGGREGERTSRARARTQKRERRDQLLAWAGWAGLDRMGWDRMGWDGQDGEMSLNAHGMGKPQSHQGTRTIISDTKANGDGRRESDMTGRLG